MVSGLLGLILVIAIIGLVVYALEAFIPMAEPFKTVIRIIAGIICLILLLQLLGVALPFSRLSR